jgi:type IV pilus assembly protein PilY1
LQNAISTVVNDAISRDGAAAAVAVTNANVSATTSAFQAGYNSGSWTGDLQSYRLDQATGSTDHRPAPLGSLGTGAAR